MPIAITFEIWLYIMILMDDAHSNILNCVKWSHKNEMFKRVGCLALVDVDGNHNVDKIIQPNQV